MNAQERAQFLKMQTELTNTRNEVEQLYSILSEFAHHLDKTDQNMTAVFQKMNMTRVTGEQKRKPKDTMMHITVTASTVYCTQGMLPVTQKHKYVNLFRTSQAGVIGLEFSNTPGAYTASGVYCSGTNTYLTSVNVVNTVFAAALRELSEVLKTKTTCKFWNCEQDATNENRFFAWPNTLAFALRDDVTFEKEFFSAPPVKPLCINVMRKTHGAIRLQGVASHFGDIFITSADIEPIDETHIQFTLHPNFLGKHKVRISKTGGRGTPEISANALIEELGLGRDGDNVKYYAQKTGENTFIISTDVEEDEEFRLSYVFAQRQQQEKAKADKVATKPQKNRYGYIPAAPVDNTAFTYDPKKDEHAQAESFADLFK